MEEKRQLQDISFFTEKNKKNPNEINI